MEIVPLVLPFGQWNCFDMLADLETLQHSLSFDIQGDSQWWHLLAKYGVKLSPCQKSQLIDFYQLPEHFEYLLECATKTKDAQLPIFYH
jgi:hypothetical protein